MAKKLKEWYDSEYLHRLAEIITTHASSEFNSDLFLSSTLPNISELEFGQRQGLIAKALRGSLSLPYEESLTVFNQILGRELPTNEGNFTEGYWLWPIGKFVELYGADYLQASLDFAYELTKRFTSEYCMRPLIEKAPEVVLPIIVEWSRDDNIRVKRLASECMRIRLPWAKKMFVALEYFDQYQAILTQLKDDPDSYIQKSVANNLNDLYKESPNHFQQIIGYWQTLPESSASQWIIKHGSRNVKE